MKILKKEKIREVSVSPGDTLQLEYQEEGQPSRVLLTHEITEEAYYDTAIIVRFESGELGLKHGLGGVIGKDEA